MATQVTETVTGGKLLCVPMDLMRGDPTRFTRLLDHMADHPLWFSDNATRDEARVTASWMLTDPTLWKYEVWNGGHFAGAFLLSRVIPKVDAIFHFTLLPYEQSQTTLFGARALAWNFLGHAFEEFGFRRLSVEIPEYLPKLAHWCRQRLGFRYEGEGNPARLRAVPGVTILEKNSALTHIAGAGSRREQCHWDGKEWRDLILLRLLRTEYDARASLGVMPKATHSDNPMRGIHESRQESRELARTQ